MKRGKLIFNKKIYRKIKKDITYLVFRKGVSTKYAMNFMIRAATFADDLYKSKYEKKLSILNYLRGQLK